MLKYQHRLSYSLCFYGLFQFVKTYTQICFVRGRMLTEWKNPWGIWENKTPACAGISFSKCPASLFSHHTQQVSNGHPTGYHRKKGFIRGLMRKVILYFWIDICAGDLHWWKDGGSNWQTWPESSWELPKYCAGRRWTHPCWLHQHYHASKSSILCMSVEDNVLPMLTLFWVKDSATGLLDYCYQILSLHANAQSVITERRGHGCSSGYWWIWKNVTPLIWFYSMSLTIHFGGTFQSIEDCSASSGLFSCKNIQTVLS